MDPVQNKKHLVIHAALDADSAQHKIPVTAQSDMFIKAISQYFIATSG